MRAASTHLDISYPWYGAAKTSPIYPRRLRGSHLCQRHRSRYVCLVIANKQTTEHGLGILHTVFFHRYFPSLRPSSIEVLDLTLPLVADPELETLIDTRVGQLIRQLNSTSSPKSSVRGSLVVQFFEKKRRKGGGGLGWFTGGAKGDEEVCWESWCLEVTLATPKTEIGMPTEPKQSIKDPPLLTVQQNGPRS